MKPKSLCRLRDSEGKGVFGCLVLLVLAGVAIYLAIVLTPIYYTNFNFENDVKTEVSRAGAKFLDDETVINDILAMAKRNEVKLNREDVSAERFAGQIQVRVQYSVPVDFIIFERKLVFKINASSFIGTL